MEATTPPNTAGFSRKPNRKNRRSSRRRKSNGYRMQKAIENMPYNVKAWLYGSMFLMAVAKILAPMMGLNASESVTQTAD